MPTNNKQFSVLFTWHDGTHGFFYFMRLVLNKWFVRTNIENAASAMVCINSFSNVFVTTEKLIIHTGTRNCF